MMRFKSRIINKHGLTVLELMMAIGLAAFVVAAITAIYVTCGKAFNAGQDRSKVRTEVANLLDLMTRDINKASSVTCTSATVLTFDMDGATYTYELSGSSMKRGTSAKITKATGIQTPGGGISNIFSCSGALVTVDITAKNYGQTFRARTKIKARNVT